MTTLFVRGSTACIIVADPTEKKSFESAKEWRNIVYEELAESSHNQNLKDFPFILLSNKSDLLNKQK